jgi:hypothetical protein
MSEGPSKTKKIKHVFICHKEIRIDREINKKNEGQKCSMIEGKKNSLKKENRIGSILKDSKVKLGRWTDEEHERFLNACFDHPNDWLKVK